MTREEQHTVGLWSDQVDLGEMLCTVKVVYDIAYDYDDGYVCDGADVTILDAIDAQGWHVSPYHLRNCIKPAGVEAAEKRLAEKLVRDWTKEMME